MYTEDEAKEKICCENNFEYPHYRRCTASMCMAWRWERTLSPSKHETLTVSKLVDSTTHGYCGLAGKP